MTKALFYEYSACGTCKKAKKWLDAHAVRYEAIPIVDKPPSERQLRGWIAKSQLPARKWFNSSGQSYRNLIAEKGRGFIDGLTDAQIAGLLARDGKLIKRPILVVGDTIRVGFDEASYAEELASLAPAG